MRTGIFQVFLFFAVGWMTAAQAQSIEVYLPADSVNTGVPFEVSLVAVYPESMDLVMPRVDSDGSPMWGDIVLLSLDDREVTRSSPGALRDSLVFRAAVYVADSALTAPGTVHFATSSDTVALQIPRYTLLVAATVPPGAEPRSILPITGAPMSRWWLVALAAVVLLIVAAVVLWRRRSGKPVHESEEGRLPPLEEALVALERLSSATTSRSEQDRLFVIGLSDILREFIARRLNTSARERTSAELMRDLSHHPDLPAGMVDSLKPLLITMDSVKFAGADLKWQRHDVIHRVKQWIVEADRLIVLRERAEEPVVSP